MSLKNKLNRMKTHMNLGKHPSPIEEDDRTVNEEIPYYESGWRTIPFPFTSMVTIVSLGKSATL